jgi:hypothetical protein
VQVLEDADEAHHDVVQLSVMPEPLVWLYVVVNF